MKKKVRKRIGPGRPAPGGQKSPRQPASTFVQTTALVFISVAILTWLSIAPRLFPREPGGGFDMTRVLAAAAVGGVAGGLGIGVAKLIERRRR
jgi:hypothetical protein